MYKSGYSVLLLTIIISTIGVALAVNDLSNSTQVARTNINITDVVFDQSQAESCVEKVFAKLRAYKSYEGDETFEGGCRVYTISRNIDGTRTIYTKVDSIILETKVKKLKPYIIIDYQKPITIAELNQSQENNPYLIAPSALRLWLKADRAETNNEQPVFSVKNATDDIKSSDNKLIDFAQSPTQSSRAPKLITNAINNRPALRFDGIDDFLTSTTTPIHTNNGLSIIVVGKTFNINNNNQTYISKFNTTSDTINKEWRLQNDELNIVNNTINITYTPNATSNTKILSAIWSPDNPQLSISINNNTASTATGDIPIATTNEPIIVGANNQGQGGSGFLNGDIAEILVYNKKLSDTELNKVRTYMNNKYSIY